MKTAALYLRVSTEDQHTGMQRRELMAAASRRGYEVEVFEDHDSGAKVSREGLDAMMRGVRAGRYAVVMAYKLDRLGRSLPHLIQLIGELESLGVGLIVSADGIDTSGAESNPAAKLTLHVLGAVAEFERSIIAQRTKAGLRAAKARGKKLGRPKGSRGVPDLRRRKAFEMLDADPTTTLARIGHDLKVSRGTAWRWRNEWRKGLRDG